MKIFFDFTKKISGDTDFVLSANNDRGRPNSRWVAKGDEKTLPRSALRCQSNYVSTKDYRLEQILVQNARLCWFGNSIHELCSQMEIFSKQ